MHTALSQFVFQLAAEAAKFPTFSLRMETEALELIESAKDGRITGVRATTRDGELEIDGYGGFVGLPKGSVAICKPEDLDGKHEQYEASSLLGVYSLESSNYSDSWIPPCKTKMQTRLCTQAVSR